MDREYITTKVLNVASEFLDDIRNKNIKVTGSFICSGPIRCLREFE